MSPSIRPSVGLLVGRRSAIIYQIGDNFHFHSPIGALVMYERVAMWSMRQKEKEIVVSVVAAHFVTNF